MGKKSRKNASKKNLTKNAPDEVINYGPLSIERYGRFIQFSNNATAEEQTAFLKRSEEINKKIPKELGQEIKILQDLVKHFDPTELMSRAAHILLPLFIEHRSENEYSPDESYSLPTAEYLQYLIARTEANTDGKIPSDTEWEQIWNHAKETLKLTQGYIFTRKTLKTPPSEIDELRYDIDSRRLMVRVKRYPFFLSDYLQTSLVPYEQWIKEIYGVDVKEIIEGLEKIHDYLKTGVMGRYNDVFNLEKILIIKLKEKGYGVDPGLSPDEIERTRKALESDEFKKLYDETEEKMRLAFTPALFEITDLTSLPKSFLSLLSVKPGESILTKLTGPNHDDLSPLSPSILHYKPFLEADGKFYTFYHSGFEDRIAEIIEEDLFQKQPNHISVMAKKRSNRIESDAKDLLSLIINPDFAFQNVYYPNPDEVGNLTELDILIGIDDILFLAEIKAGGFSDAANRGAPDSLAQEFSDLIIEGQRQSERAERYIKSDNEVAFFDETGKREIFKIRHSDFRKVFRVIVTKEDLGWVGAKIAILSILDPNLNKSFPWHISIDDLRIVAELFKDDPIRFVHYLEQRLQASSETTLHQNDEIEHIALYNKINWYHELPVQGMNQISFDPSYMRDIDYYFAEKALGNAPKVPTQDMPVKMREFINALKSCHLPRRFEVGSSILSLDNIGRNQLKKVLEALDQGRAEGRQRTFRMPLSKVGHSITCVDDSHWQEELRRSAVQMEQSECEKWFIVQLANKSPYEISQIEVISKGRFSEEELAAERLRREEILQKEIANKKIGRNEKCPCGSGKKYKKCHMGSKIK